MSSVPSRSSPDPDIELCRKIVREVSEVPTFQTLSRVIADHRSELKRILLYGTSHPRYRYERIHGLMVNRVCAAAVESIPHVDHFDAAEVIWENRHRTVRRKVRLGKEVSDTFHSKRRYLVWAVLSALRIDPAGDLADWVSEALRKALERSVEDGANSGHADIRIIEGELQMLTVKLLDDGTATHGSGVSPERESALRADAVLVLPGFTPDTPEGFTSQKGFNGLLLVPDCGFEVYSPERLEVSLVTHSGISSVTHPVDRQMLLKEDWSSLAQRFAVGLGFHPVDTYRGGMSRLNKMRLIGDAIQATVLTGKKSVVAHHTLREYTVIVNPVPDTVRLDAFRTDISSPLTDGWL